MLFFDAFNEKMAKATVNGFKKLSNKDKRDFIEDFNRFWKNGFIEEYRKNFNYKSSLDGFKILKYEIEQYRKECKKMSMTIAAAHSTNFIENLDCIISQLENMELNDLIR